MSPRFLCLQGHQWEYEEREVPKALFCPTCGLRLYAEKQGALDSSHVAPFHAPYANAYEQCGYLAIQPQLAG